MSLFMMWVGLTLGAVVYQAMTHHDWMRAFDTSWDQAVALGLVWFVGRKFFIAPQDSRPSPSAPGASAPAQRPRG